MALARREFQVQDERGNVVLGAQVEVRREVGGQPLESLFSDRDGAVPLTNPFTVSDPNGIAAFHCVGGAFQITVTAGSFSRVMRYVPVGTAAEADALTLLNDAGDVDGPESATDGQLALFSGETGNLIAGAVIDSPPMPLTLSALLSLVGAGGGGGISSIALQAFTTPGANIYTPTAGMAYCLVVSTGAGGGGGGADGLDTSMNAAAGGGGAGSTCVELFSAATIGASQSVTIGAAGTAGSDAGGNGGNGGDTTFGALHTAGGGLGGVGISTGATGIGGPVAGGTPSGGAVNIPGGYGGPGHVGVSDDVQTGGYGGASFWGGGPASTPRVASDGATAGVAGTGYGTGGSGASCQNSTTGAAGGAGAPGLCLVLEFIA